MGFGGRLKEAEVHGGASLIALRGEDAGRIHPRRLLSCRLHMYCACTHVLQGPTPHTPHVYLSCKACGAGAEHVHVPTQTDGRMELLSTGTSLSALGLGSPIVPVQQHTTHGLLRAETRRTLVCRVCPPTLPEVLHGHPHPAVLALDRPSSTAQYDSNCFCRGALDKLGK